MPLSRSIIFLSLLVAVSTSQAQSLCRDLFSAAPRLGSLSPEKQLLYWEQNSNLPQMREGSAPVWLNEAIAPYAQIKTVSIGSVGARILQYFSKAPGIFWPQHPLNTDTTVPFATKDRVGLLKAFWSASRSFYFYIGDQLFSVKMPTNQTHERSNPEPSKTDMSLTQLELNRSRVIEERDAQLPESPYLRVLHDVAAVADKKTGSGYLVRDLTPLQDGNYYLPAFAIPYVGRDIAARFGETFENFWGKHYAEPVGRIKAELLLRYGLILTSPHPQNLLVQLNANFEPTGKIYVRDIADSVYMEAAAIALGLQVEVRKDINNGRSVSPFTDINSENTFSRFEEAGLNPKLLKQWENQHDLAFVERMVNQLQLDPVAYNNFYQVVSVFNTDTGVAQLKRFDASQAR